MSFAQLIKQNEHGVHKTYHHRWQHVGTNSVKLVQVAEQESGFLEELISKITVSVHECFKSYVSCEQRFLISQGKSYVNHWLHKL